MSRAILESVGICLFILTASLLGATLQGLDAPLSYEPGTGTEMLRLGWSAPEVYERSSKTADFISYLRQAQELRAGLPFSEFSMSLWTPGQFFLITGVLEVFGEANYGLKLVLVAAVFWAIALAMFALLTPPTKSPLWNMAIASTFLLLPTMRAWNFGFGALMSDGAGAAFFLMSMVAFAKAVTTERRAWFIAAALLTAIATYFRIFFDYAATALFFMTGFAVVVGWIYRNRSVKQTARELFKRAPISRGNLRLRALLLNLVLAFAIHKVSLEPWKMYKSSHIGSRALYTRYLKDQLYWNWAKDSDVPGYVAAANPACHADPVLCQRMQAEFETMNGKEYRNLTVMTFVAHPFAWITFKLAGFDYLWWGESIRFMLDHPLFAIEGVVLLVLGSLGLVWIARAAYRKRPLNVLVYAVAVGGFMFVSSMVFAVLPFEWRYSAPLRVLMFFLPGLALYLSREGTLLGGAERVIIDGHPEGQ